MPIFDSIPDQIAEPKLSPMNDEYCVVEVWSA